ncbi:MAG: TetR/AcrR family transcriptional regulator [Phycisphaeraceae bacterium]|nr:TetR/AcrR family transcriptional regulator [Phycisphaeraceae bacterium]
MTRVDPPRKSRSASSRRWEQTPPDQRQRLIVDVALDLLTRKGLEAVTIRRVAQRLGVGAMTLYTYIPGQSGLRAAMIQRGFEMLHQGCAEASTLDTPQGWLGGARSYIRFALSHPNLYRLMFDVPVAPDDAESQMLRGGFQGLLDKVRERLNHDDIPPDQIDRTVRLHAGRFWIALHGIASLAIAGRLHVLGSDVEAILTEVIERLAPPQASNASPLVHSS